jgi:hypothetical protein
MEDINVLKDIIAKQTIEIHQLNKRLELMTSTDWGDGWIYESPDGGKTIYRRRPGSPVKSRVQINVEDLPTFTWNDGQWTSNNSLMYFDNKGMDNDIDKQTF